MPLVRKVWSSILNSSLTKVALVDPRAKSNGADGRNRELVELSNRGSYEMQRTIALARSIGPLAKPQTAKVTLSLALLVLALVVLASNYDLSKIQSDIRGLSPSVVAIFSSALLANALIAAIRFKAISGDMGYPVSFRQAMTAVSAGGLASALFFQVAGQLIARGAVMGKTGTPFANVVVITVYERVIAAVLSAVAALAGAYFIFGKIYLDPTSGSIDLIKITCGLIATAAVGAMLGYGRTAAHAIAPYMTMRFAHQLLKIMILTGLVQVPMMIAYVAISHSLSLKTPVADLVAASLVVMFAASVPISLAGWGIREMSAVAALSTIGVPSHVAFTTAILVGFGSLVAMGVILSVSMLGSVSKNTARAAVPEKEPIDYGRALRWFIPLAAATLVLFQIYVPIGAGLLNVNLADPVVILGGALFLLAAIKSRRVPQWRVSYVNIAVIAVTVSLTGSLLLGADRFGWTTWALVNRYCGWFFLLSYGATGALLVLEGGSRALRIFALTFVGATVAVAGIDLTLVLLKQAGLHGIDSIIKPGNIEGFAQNRNFFAFELVMALGAVACFAAGKYLRIGLLVLLLTSLWATGSRSGWISAVLVMGTAFYFGQLRMTESTVGAAFAVAASLALLYVGSANGLLGRVTALIESGPYAHAAENAPSIPPTAAIAAAGPVTVTAAGTTRTTVLIPVPPPLPPLVPSESDLQERLLTLRGGIDLFWRNPVFGAGLGAFRNENIPSTTTGIPLLIHSAPLWLLAELGLVGFIVFALPGAYVFVTEWRRVQRDQAAAFGVLLMLAFALMCAPADMIYQRTFWLLIGAALAVPGVGKFQSVTSRRWSAQPEKSFLASLNIWPTIALPASPQLNWR